MKKMLILQASEDIQKAEITNIVSQIAMYNIEAETRSVSSYSNLYDTLNSGSKFDYIYLASHGCETHWGNISGTVNVNWTSFAALVCSSGVAKPGAIFLHSCCRGGLSQVAYQMFACCPKIEFVCGPRHDIHPVDLVISFNLFLYNIEVKRIDPVRSAEKVLAATDIRLLCSDRIETDSKADYITYCKLIDNQITNAFTEINNFETHNLSVFQVERPSDLE